MAEIPYNATNGEDIYDGTKDIKTPNDAYDPTVTSPYLMEARDLADLRDFAEYIRQSTVIGNAKKIQGVTVSVSTPTNGQTWVYNSTTEQWEPGEIEVSDQERITFTPQTAAQQTWSEGKIYYDDDRKNWVFYNDRSSVARDITREIGPRIANNTGVAFSNGAVVYISGSSGAIAEAELADSTAFATSRIIAVTTETIATGTNGEATSFGLVRDIDTSAWAPGTCLFLDPDNPGGMTSTKPIDSSFSCGVAKVIVQSATVGSIFVMISCDERAAELNLEYGWSDRSAQTLSWSDVTRTITITPTGDDFTFYEGAVQYRKTTDTFTIPDTEGLHIIYYHEGTLASILNPTMGQVDAILRNNPTVSYIYWNATDSVAEYVAFELHGAEGTYGLGKSNHVYNHFTRGAQWLSGLTLSSISADESGATDSHAQFAIDSGGFTDEDLPFFPAAITSTTGTPINYFSGAGALFRSDTETGFSVLTDTTAGVGATGRLVYNLNTAGTYSLATVDDNDHVLCHIFTANDNDGSKIIRSLVGLAQYGTAELATTGCIGEINTIKGLLPNSEEWVWIGSLIYNTKSTYANAVSARVVSTSEGDDYIDGINRTVAGGSTGGGSGTPGGGTNSIQVNSAGAFVGYTGFELDLATGRLYAPEHLDMTEEAGTATTPAAGHRIIYPKSDGWYEMDDAGVESQLGAGSGDMLASTYDPTAVNGDAFDMDNMAEGATNKILTAAERTILGNTSGTNTGDQTSIVGITGTIAQFNTSLTDGSFATGGGTATGTNTGDQDLSALATKANVLELDNTTVFTPTLDYHPSTKKYVDDNAGGGGDVTGPASSTDNSVALFSGTTGKILKEGPDMVEQYVSAPATPTSTGTKGQKAYSSNYLYECVDTDTWVRASVESSWS